MKKNLLLLVFFFSNSVDLFGKRPFPLYESPRLQGFGGAGTALVEGEDAIFYNPSQINSKKGHQLISIVSPTITFTTIRPEEAVQTATAYSSYSNVKNITEHFNLFKKGNVFLGAQNHTGFILDHSAFGILGTMQRNLHMDDGDGKPLTQESIDNLRYDFETMYDLSTYFGASRTFFTNFDVGFLARFVYTLSQSLTKTVAGVEDTKDINTSNNTLDLATEKSGLGIGGDLGVTYHLPNDNADITFAAVAQNILALHYFGPNKPDNVPMAINLGFGYKRSLFRSEQNFLIAIDLKDILSQHEPYLLTKLHMGVMWRYSDLVSLSTGLNQGYPTFGLGLAYKFIELQFAHYAVELSKTGQSRPSKRNSLLLRVGWLF